MYLWPLGSDLHSGRGTLYFNMIVNVPMNVLSENVFEFLYRCGMLGKLTFSSLSLR